MKEASGKVTGAADVLEHTLGENQGDGDIDAPFNWSRRSVLWIRRFV